MIWILLIVGIVLVAMFWPAGMKAAPNELGSPEEITLTLRHLLERGVEGGSVRFQVRDDESRQLVFTKYIKSRHDVGMRSCIPMTDGGDQAVGRLTQELSDRNIRFSEREEKRRRCIVIDYGSDLGLAQLVARIMFERVFEVRIERDCVAYYKDVLMTNVPHLTGMDKVNSYFD